MSAGFCWKWRTIIPFSAKEQEGHTSFTWIERPTREEIQHNKGPNLDHWQVDPKSSPTEEGEGRWAQWGGRPTSPWAPPPSGFDVAAPHWMMKSVQEVPCTIPGHGEGGSHLYIWGEGLHFKTSHNLKTTHIIQVTLSRCSSSSLVEVLGLEELGYES